MSIVHAPTPPGQDAPGPHSFPISTVIWLAWLGILAVLELLAVYTNLVPWMPLSDWTWRLEGLSPFVPWVVLVGMAILLVHLVARWP